MKMKYNVFVGTYTGGLDSDSAITGSKGIYVFDFDDKNGKLKLLGSFGRNDIDPAFLECRLGFLYVENERKDKAVIHSFRIKQNELPEFVDKIETEGSKCAHICLDNKGPYVIGSVYASGNVVVAKADSNGKLSITDNVKHCGHSIVPKRQEGPHAHSARFSPDGTLLVVPDLGADKVILYELNRTSGKLESHMEQPFIEVDAGQGPRHFVYHPDGKTAYLLTEIGNSIYAYEWDKRKKKFIMLERYSTIPEDYEGISHAAEIRITADGKYLYASNRGHDSIVGFQVKKDGRLIKIGNFFCPGKGPRHICLSPDERYIIVANKDSDNVCVIEKKLDGTLGKIVDAVTIPAPACVCWSEVSGE
ncbi:MAG: lactonase family protein [Oliverpabstia sp.]